MMSGSRLLKRRLPATGKRTIAKSGQPCTSDDDDRRLRQQKSATRWMQSKRYGSRKIYNDWVSAGKRQRQRPSTDRNKVRAEGIQTRPESRSRSHHHLCQITSNNTTISQLPKLCVKISILMHKRMWVHSFSTRLTSVTFAEDKVLIFLILRKNAKIVQL